MPLLVPLLHSCLVPQMLKRNWLAYLHSCLSVFKINIVENFPKKEKLFNRKFSISSETDIFKNILSKKKISFKTENSRNNNKVDLIDI